MTLVTERISRPDLSHSPNLIERGDLVLHVLAKEAQAARAEAKMAELQVALAQARKGDDLPLRNWLDRNPEILTQFSYSGTDVSLPVVNTLPVPPSPVGVKSATTKTNVEPKFEIVNPEVFVDTWPTSWDEMAEHARQRIAQRTSSSDPNEPDTSIKCSEPTVALEIASDSSPSSIQAKIAPISEKSAYMFHEEVSDVCLEDSLTIDSDVDREKDAEAQPAEALKATLIDLGLPETQLKRAEPTKLWFQNYKSTAASVLVHLALVLAMTFIGFKLPSTVASLALQGSAPEASETTFELTEVVDTSSNMEVTSSEEIAEPNIDTSAPVLSAGLPDASSLASANATSPLSAAGTGASIAGAMAATSQGSSGGKSGPNLKNMGASFFGASSSGNSFCYVIDASESMRGGAWESAKAELLRSIQSMKPNQRFYIIFFNQETQAIPMPGQREAAPYLLYATPENVRHARNWIETLKLAKGAPPNDALELAISREPEAIYLLTDGVTKVDVPAFLRQNNRTSDILFGEQVRVPIHAIAYHSQSGEQLMRKVASENKGQFIYVPKPTRK